MQKKTENLVRSKIQLNNIRSRINFFSIPPWWFSETQTYQINNNHQKLSVSCLFVFIKKTNFRWIFFSHTKISFYSLIQITCGTLNKLKYLCDGIRFGPFLSMFFFVVVPFQYCLKQKVFFFFVILSYNNKQVNVCVFVMLCNQFKYIRHRGQFLNRNDNYNSCVGNSNCME